MTVTTDGNDHETMAADGNETNNTKDTWTWHILLSRSRLPVTAKSSDAVPIDSRLPHVTLGYFVDVYRMKSAEEQDAEDRSAAPVDDAVPTPCPWLAPPDDDDASRFPCFDAEAYEAWEEKSRSEPTGNPDPFGALASTLPACPLGADLFMLHKLRKIFEKRLMENFSGLAWRAVENTLLYLLDGDWGKKFSESDAKYGATCFKETGLAESLRSFGYSGEDWGEAVGKRAERIVFHVPEEDESALRASLEGFCREKLPGVNVRVEGPPSRESANWVTRTMAALDFNNHYSARVDMLHQGPVPADFRHGRDCVDCGSEEYWCAGEPMRHLPERGSREFRHLRSAHTNACKLLALRPWSKLKRFEVLKVTVKHCNGEPNTKYVFFSGNGGGEADCTSSSPFGFMQLLEEKSQLDFFFGRTSMYLKSGIYASNSNPDRVFLSTESYTEVHYDAIALLEHLFGDALVPDQLLPRGIVPLFEGQTGQMFSSSDVRGRRLTGEEMGWLDGALPALAKFVEEEAAHCVPSHGEQTRSYSVPAPFGQDGSTHVVSGRASAVNIVTVSYNMDVRNGGLWDPHRKWQWF